MNTRAHSRFELPANPKIEFVETEDVVLDGEPLTDERVEEIVEDVRHANLVPGGKSLNDDGSHSPRLSVRVPDSLNDVLKEVAAERGVGVSRLVRDVLVEWAQFREVVGHRPPERPRRSKAEEEAVSQVFGAYLVDAADHRCEFPAWGATLVGWQRPVDDAHGADFLVFVSEPKMIRARAARRKRSDFGIGA